jgi:hypothetical protein
MTRSPPPGPRRRTRGWWVTSSDLAITVDAAGTQQLVYELRATKSSGFYVWLNVDALSGYVTVMGRG